MQTVLPFLLGILVTVLLQLVLRSRRPADGFGAYDVEPLEDAGSLPVLMAPVPESEPAVSTAAPVETDDLPAVTVDDLIPRRVMIGFDRELLDAAERHLEALAAGAGSELGDLATAVEGHANLLCEAIGNPELVAARAEQLWTGVRRMRLFSEKLLSFANPPEVEPIPMELLDLLDLIHGDLESYASGSFQVQFETAPFLPPADIDPDHLRKSILFLVDTLLAVQPDTRQITLRAFAAIPDDDSPIVCIELCAEAEADVPIRKRATSELQLGYLAARNTLEGMNAHLAFEHVEELDVSCQIMLAAVLDPDAPLIGARRPVPDVRPEDVPPSRHNFGGILILEDDRSVRELLSMELGRSGRNILTCNDGASARSLIEATPDRFELLILDSAAPLESGEHLAEHALHLQPDFKILLLTDALGLSTGGADLPRDRVIALGKPFNLSDLRTAVRRLMGSCPPPPLVAMTGHEAFDQTS